MRFLVATIVSLMVSSAHAEGTFGIEYPEGEKCGNVNMKAAVERMLDLAIASQGADCLGSRELKDAAELVRQRRLDHTINVLCAKDGLKVTCGGSSSLCGVREGNSVRAGPVAAMDAYAHLSFGTKNLKGYDCPAIPDNAIAIAHEILGHAVPLTQGRMDTTIVRIGATPKERTTQTQLDAISFENILRRSLGQCQRSRTGRAGDPDEPLVDIASRIPKCECDPANVDKWLGPADRCIEGLTCCNRRCVATLINSANCGGCGRTCNGCCQGGQCKACTKVGAACDYIDSSTASSLMGLEVVEQNATPADITCNFKGKPDPKERLDNSWVTLVVTPHGGTSVKNFETQLRANLAAITDEYQWQKYGSPLGLAAFVLDSAPRALQLVVLLPNATLDLSITMKRGIPEGSLDRLAAALEDIAKRIESPPAPTTPPPAVANENSDPPGPPPPRMPTADEALGEQKFIARDDEAKTVVDVPVTIDVLANDTPRLPMAVSSVGFGQSTNGRMRSNANDTLTYTPNPGFVGTDQFTYIVTVMGRIVGQATVRVTVREP